MERCGLDIKKLKFKGLVLSPETVQRKYIGVWMPPPRLEGTERPHLS
jgi:hypothetical protein